VSEPDAVAHLERELAVLLRRARGRWAQLAREVHPELDPAAYGLLRRIDDAGTARMTDLSTYFGVGKPTISRQVQLLENLGLVERSADATDGRAQALTLTGEGLRRVRRVREARGAQVRAMLSTWPADDISALAALLRRFNETMEHRG
jgi:DNA-binding MarR family transcriptional regulator